MTRPLIISFHSFLYFFLGAVQFHSWHELTIGQNFQPIFSSLYASEFFYIAIPRSYVIIPDRPINSNSILGIRLKIPFVEPVTLPTPHQGTTTYVISTEPIESFYFGVRALRVFYPKVQNSFIQCIVSF